MKHSLEEFLRKNQRDSAARAATEELAPKLHGKRVFISVDRFGKVTHRAPRSADTSVSRMLGVPSKSLESNGKTKLKIPRQGSKNDLKRALVETVRLIAGTE